MHHCAQRREFRLLEVVTMTATHAGTRKKSSMRRWKRTLRRASPLVGVPILFIVLALSMELLEYRPVPTPQATKVVTQRSIPTQPPPAHRARKKSDSIDQVLRLNSDRDSELDLTVDQSQPAPLEYHAPTPRNRAALR